VQLTKSPGSNLDFSWDWNSWLDYNGDGIADENVLSSAWSVPAGVVNNGEVLTANVAGIWLSGGTVGQLYRVVNTITTVAGRVETRTFIFRCANK